jgi:APA family basic amino acid/polyamine antiporter
MCTSAKLDNLRHRFHRPLRGVALLAAALVCAFSDKNILYEIDLNSMRQIVSIFTIILVTSTVVGENSKILQTVLTVIKILSLAGLIILVLWLKRVWDANWTNA